MKGLLIYSAILVLGIGTGFFLRSNPTRIVGGIAESEITLKIQEVIEPNGITRYDIYRGDTFYSFWGLDQVEKFAHEVDYDDDEMTKLVREIVKNELSARSIGEFVTDLKLNDKTYTVSEKVVSVKEKP